MRNIDTLRYFMRYFVPHCVQKDGSTVCYVSALEYPEREDALDVLTGEGFFSRGPQHIVLRYAVLVRDNGRGWWRIGDHAGQGAYPVWEAR